VLVRVKVGVPVCVRVYVKEGVFCGVFVFDGTLV
jgi:hypothetical protein